MKINNLKNIFDSKKFYKRASRVIAAWEQATTCSVTTYLANERKLPKPAVILLIKWLENLKRRSNALVTE